MNMNTLKYFTVVAKTQQITKAAKQLHVTQPALSTAIQRLEEELGFQLFDRTGLNIKLNSYGEIFLKTANTIENAFNDGLREMELLQQREQRFVRIACSASSISAELIERIFSNEVNLTVDTLMLDWEKQLLSGNIDLVITICRSQAANICSTVLCHRKFEFVCSKNHPLASTSTLTTDDLKPYPFCSINDTSSALYVAKDVFFDSVNFDPNVSFLGRNTADLFSAIRSGKYLGLISARKLTAINDLVILPVKNLCINMPINLYWCKSKSKNSTLNSVRHTIIDFYQAKLQE